MNAYYLNNKGLWTRDSEGARLLLQPDYGKYFVLQGGAWVEVRKDDLSPLEQGYFWYFEKEEQQTLFQGVLPIHAFQETLLSGLGIKDKRGMRDTAENLGNSFYLDHQESQIFSQRAKKIGATLILKQKDVEKISFAKKIDELLAKDLIFLQELKVGDVSNRPLFHERGREIRDLAERAMRNGEDVSEKLILRAQLERKAEGGEDKEADFIILLELLHSFIENSTLLDEGIWLHFPEGDIWIGEDKRIFLRGK